LADREPSLIRLYMELTGAEESAARGVFMYVCDYEEHRPQKGNGGGVTAREEGRRGVFELEFGGTGDRIKPCLGFAVAGGV